MKTTFRRLSYAFAWGGIVLAVTSQSHGWAKSEAPTHDPKLESKLIVIARYKVRAGDTLSTVAHLLYGHTSWWVKLRKDNPKFIGFDANQALPKGATLVYRAPKVGEEYVVQPNDWLVRIAEWKYGSSDYWQQLFERNSGQIQNPNLIHPGDHLILGSNGTIKNLRTGRTVLEGIDTANTALIAPERQPAARPKSWQESSHEEVQNLLTLAMDSQYRAFFVGFALGLLALLLMPLGFWTLRRLRMRPATASRPPLPAKENKSGFAARKSGEKRWEFKRPPVEEPQIDRSRVPRDAREVDRRPGYHSLLKSPLKKYLKYFGKG